MNEPNPSSLKDVRILDLTRILAGPTCTQLLGDLGADVIKVEKPFTGDDTRKWGPPFIKCADQSDSTESAYYLCANRNKRSVTVDISKPDGSELIRKLVTHCDVLIENFKPGGLAQYGLSYDDLKNENPHLVYCSISGFGQTGPNSKLPGYDIVAQGFGGIMGLTGEPSGEPMKVGVGIADVMCGMYASTAILAALHHRNKTNEGQYIDIALVDTSIAWLVNEGTSYLTSGVKPLRWGNQHPSIVPYQIFETADGHIIVAVGNDMQFQRLCDLLGISELADNPQFSTNSTRLENRNKLIGLLQPYICKFNTKTLLELLQIHGVPVGPVHSVHEAFESEQVAARNMKVTMPHPLSANGQINLIGNPIKLSKTPVSYRRSPPILGADTEDVVRELLGEEGIKLAHY